MIKRISLTLTVVLLCVYGYLVMAQQGGGGFRIPNLAMHTDAFEDGAVIPDKYSFRGGNTQPGFTFTNPEQGTVCYRHHP